MKNGKLLSKFETVSKKYSYRLALRSTLFVCLGALFSVLFLYTFLAKQEASSYAESFQMLSGVKDELLYRSTLIYLITSFFTIVGIILITLFYSHRVAGPVYKLELVAGRIASGNLGEKAVMRRNDVIRPMADDLDRIMSTYGDILAQLETELQGLKEGVTGIQVTDSPAAGADMRQTMVIISTRVEEINKILSKIKL